MRKIYTIGETVYDVVFHQGSIEAGRAGGSMLNASVSLGRLGAEVCFVSELGHDDLGDVIAAFLEDNGVSTRHIHRFSEGRTPLALAFLDEHRNARYSFYKSYPPVRLQQDFPVVHAEDVLIFGSFFSISPEVREPLIRFVKQARSAGALIIYDPNIRRPHRHEIPQLIPLIRENMALADIIRASHEDFEVILNIGTGENAFDYVRNLGVRVLIYTRGAAQVELYTGDQASRFDVPPVEVISTIGAGDSFNAGLAWMLLRENIDRQNIPRLQPALWAKIVSTATAFGSNVCRSYDNYISMDFAHEIRDGRQ